VGPPSRPLLDHTGRDLRREANGKPRWEPVVTFINEQVRARFSQRVLDLLLEAYPDALDEEGEP
jgi:hypothetical protein